MSDKKVQGVKVYARQRPFTPIEIAQKCTSLVHKVSSHEVVLKSDSNERRFVFEGVFNEDSSQLHVYNAVVSPLIHNVISGFNCTVLAHGPTGAGKTHTIFGQIQEGGDITLTEQSCLGLAPRVADQLFLALSKLSGNTEYTVKISFIEIFNEEIRDLFKESTPLRMYDDPLNKKSVCIKDLSNVSVVSTNNVLNWLNIGLKQRQNGATNANLHSSRSHSLFTFTVEVKEQISKTEDIIKTGRLQLIDLAGSENTSRTTDVRAREAGTINRSIITLTKVIKGLANKLQHIPVRDSKLTRILQESLGGKTKTSMIVTFSPNADTWDETIAALDLGIAAKSVYNTPQVNLIKKHANLMHELQDEITKLKEELIAARNGDGYFVSNDSYQKMTEEMVVKKQKVKFLIAKINELEKKVSVLQNESGKVSSLSEQNKTHLEDISKILKTTQEQQHHNVKETENKFKQIKAVHDTANVLLDVCENSTKKEEIFHKKFQERCASTTTNAQLAQNMLFSTKTFLKNVANGSDEHTKHASQNFRVFKESMNKWKNVLFNELNSIEHLKSDFQRCYQQFIANTHTNVRIDSDFLKDTKSVVVGIANQHRLAMDNVVDEFVKYEDLGAQSVDLKNRFEVIRNDVQSKKDTIKNTIQKVNDIRAALKKREQHIMKKLQDAEIKYAAEKAAHDELTQKVNDLTGNLTDVEKTSKEVGQLTMGWVEGNDKVIHSINHCMDEVSNFCESSKSMIDGVVTRINANRNALSVEATNNENIVKELAEEVASEAKEKLLKRNTELLLPLPEFKTSLQELKVAAARRLTEDVTSANLALKNMLESEQEQNTLLTDSIIERLNLLKELRDRVSFVAHVGDTPVKGTYSYPRKIRGNSNLDSTMEEDDDSNKEN